MFYERTVFTCIPIYPVVGSHWIQHTAAHCRYMQRVGHNASMAVVCMSVSVSCLTQVENGSWKLAGGPTPWSHLEFERSNTCLRNFGIEELVRFTWALMSNGRLGLTKLKALGRCSSPLAEGGGILRRPHSSLYSVFYNKMTNDYLAIKDIMYHSRLH